MKNTPNGIHYLNPCKLLNGPNEVEPIDGKRSSVQKYVIINDVTWDVMANLLIKILSLQCNVHWPSPLYNSYVYKLATSFGK
jgi:hypothetical protein